METTANRILTVVFVTAAVLGLITSYHAMTGNRAEVITMMWVDFSWYVATWLCMAARLLFKGPYRNPEKAKPSEVSCLDEYVL